jgi:hypothetical protein
MSFGQQPGVSSFGQYRDQPPPEEVEPLTPPPVLHIPAAVVLDQASLQLMAFQIATAVAQALHDGMAAALDPDGDELPVDGPAPGLPEPARYLNVPG